MPQAPASQSLHQAPSIHHVQGQPVLTVPSASNMPRPYDPPTEQTALLSPSSSPGPDSPIASSGRPGSSDPSAPDASPGPGPSPAEPVASARAVAIALALCTLIFIQATNISGMTTIQDPIAAALDAHTSTPWFTSAYLVAMASTHPLAGRLSTIFPIGALTTAAALLFVAGAALCGLSPSLGVFLLGRALSGVGAGGVITLAAVLVLQLAGVRYRGALLGLIAATITMGVAFGAVVFAAVEGRVGWRPVFYLQAPVALLTTLCLRLTIPSSPSKHSSLRSKLANIDYLGAALLTLTIVLFLHSLSTTLLLTPLLLSLLCLLAFLATEHLLAANPIIPLSILSSRPALLSCLAQLGLLTSRFTTIYFSPILMVAVRGATPSAAGAILIPTNVAFATGGLVAGWLHIRRRGSFYTPCVLTTAAFASSVYSLSLITDPSTPLPLVILAVTANGLIAGANLNYTFAHLLHVTPAGTEYVATSLLSTARSFGGSFGTSIGGGVFYRLLRAGLESGFLGLDEGGQLSPEHRILVTRLLGSPGLVFRGGLSGEEMQVAVGAYSSAVRGVWHAGAVLAVLVVAIQAGTGWTPGASGEDGEARGVARDESAEAA